MKELSNTDCKILLRLLERSSKFIEANAKGTVDKNLARQLNVIAKKIRNK